MAETVGESIITFKTPDDEWGIFSNQYPAPFTYMGIRFETVEQFLYYMKAVFGRSKATAEKILECGGDSSALAKASKKQRVLENSNWDVIRSQIMRRGMRQKFLQNPELRKKLLSTGFRLLVEIPKEGLLGRILPGNDDWVRDPGKWKGKNMTGKALMQVRTDLRCADRLVEPDEVYVFPKEPFILQTPVGQMSLREIAMLPGAREAVRAYVGTALQFVALVRVNVNPDDYINQYKLPLVTMERAISRDAADIALALTRAEERAAAVEKAEEVNADPAPETEEAIGVSDAVAPEAESGAETETAATAEAFAETAPETLTFDSVETPPETQPEAQPEVQPEVLTDAPAEDLPDNISEEGFYELLYDLDEMMKLGIL